MGVLNDLSRPLTAFLSTASTWQVVLGGVLGLVTVTIVLNVLSQVLARNPHEPPVVFHWLPFVGSTIIYGMDPFDFFFSCRERYGDVFTFVLLGRKTTVCLGTKGNDFILNAKLRDVNAEEVYTPLTTPVFGKDVVYDCPNAKLMEQKKFVKFGLTTSAFQSYVGLITQETRDFASKNSKDKRFDGEGAVVSLPPIMAELTIYTASRSLQGREVRERFDSTFAELYHWLDAGFSPINFMLPSAPLPHNRKRDFAQNKLTETYMSIIEARRKAGDLKSDTQEEDMISNLMSCIYKDGTPIPDREIAHMMIALLMAGQHSSSSTITWIFLRLATRPEVQDELLEEQKAVLGVNEDGSIKDLTYDDLARLPLHQHVIRETLRLHAPIHSVMRQVKQPMPIEGTQFVIPPTHRLLAAPGVTSRMPQHFPEPMLWEPHRWDEKPSSAYAHLSPAHVKDGVAEETEDYGYGLVSKGAASPYLPFGAGRHRCIGEQFAYVQLQTILAILIRDVKFYNREGKEGELVGTDYSSLFSRPLQPAYVRWERRQKGEKS